MFAIFKKEIKTYFTSLFTYIYFSLYMLLTGIFFSLYCLENSGTQFGYYVLSRAFLVVVFFVPICTMRLFAQEKKERTDQMLFTAPVSFGSVLCGKYFATLVVVLLPILCSVLYPVTMAAYGKLDATYLAAAYIACVLVTLGLISLGMFVSALVHNSILAAVLTYAVYAVILLLRLIESLVSSEGIYHVIHEISIYNKYYDMISGILRSGDIVYLLLVAVLFFVLTWIALMTRRERTQVIVLRSAFSILLCVIISVFCLQHTEVYDFTTERILTLSEETKQVADKVTQPTKIYYMGLQSRANATYQEFLQKYEDLNENIEVIYMNIDNNRDFRETYLGDVDVITETSMLVMTKERSIYLDSANYTSSIQTSSYSYKSLLDIENQLTSAIYYVNSEDSVSVAKLSGCGEEDIPGSFRNMLKMNNYDLKDLNLEEKATAMESTFSDDCSVVFMNAPQTDYSKEALEELSEFLKNGGNLFITLDALNEDMPNLFAFLSEYGLEVQSGVVIEKNAGSYIYDTQYYIVPQIKKTVYSESVLDNNMHVFTMTSKGMKIVDSAKGYQVTEVLKTNADAFSKVEDFDNYTIKSDGDIQGPFSIAAAAEKEGEGNLFVVSSNLLLNEDVDTDSNGSNRRFFLNVLNIMTGNEDGIMIDGREINTQTAFYPTKTRTLVKIMTIAIIPIVVLVMGIVVLVIRYSNFLLRLKKGGKKSEKESV